MENHQIKCSVDECKFNSNAEYCSLPSISVGNNMCAAVEPATCETTECDSYESR